MSDNIFKDPKVKVYSPSWRQIYTRPFNDCEIQIIESCKVVVGQHSLLLKCVLCNGKTQSLPITNDSDVYSDYIPDLSKAELVEFERLAKRCIKVRIKL